MTAQASAAVASVHLIGRRPFAVDICGRHGSHGLHDNCRELCLQHSQPCALTPSAVVVRQWCGFIAMALFAIRKGASQGSRLMLRLPESACHVLGWSLGFLLLPAGAQAQSVESFYRGKTLSMVIGYPTGGSNDIYARSVARYIGKHIPGNPTVVPRNMPGGGSLVAANHVFNVAPKDGTTLALIAATIPLEERLGAPNVMFKSAGFNWIGRVAAGVNMTFVMNSVPVKSVQDTFTREVLLGASGRSSTVAIYPAVLSNVIGTRFKLVMGYQSSSTAMLAMERGEVEGHSTSLEVVRA